MGRQHGMEGRHPLSDTHMLCWVPEPSQQGSGCPFPPPCCFSQGCLLGELSILSSWNPGSRVPGSAFTSTLPGQVAQGRGKRKEMLRAWAETGWSQKEAWKIVPGLKYPQTISYCPFSWLWLWLMATGACLAAGIDAQNRERDVCGRESFLQDSRAMAWTLSEGTHFSFLWNISISALISAKSCVEDGRVVTARLPQRRICSIGARRAGQQLRRPLSVLPAVNFDGKILCIKSQDRKWGQEGGHKLFNCLHNSAEEAAKKNLPFLAVCPRAVCSRGREKWNEEPPA